MTDTNPPALCDTDHITVVIPTYQRSAHLPDAIQSVRAQTLAPDTLHLLIVDNNPTPQEQVCIETLSANFHNGINYIHAPEAGLSNARNAAMSAVKTRYVAFLDDDMVADPTWLSALLATSQRLSAGIVFGPNHARLPNPNDPCADYLRVFFSRRLDFADEAFVAATHGAGGSLLDLTLCDLPTPVFDPKLNTRGGEDDILFDALMRKGTLAAWSPNAVCAEIVPAARANSAYVTARSFGYGQGPTRICASRGLSGLPGILYYMAAGVVQLALYSPLYLWSNFRRQPVALHYKSRLSQAFGKIFWGERFSLDLYAQADTPTEPGIQIDTDPTPFTCKAG